MKSVQRDQQALSWPAEHGGRGGSKLDQLIFTDEAAIAGVPVPFLTINTVGPTIMRYGTAEQKALYLHRIAGGEIHFSIGYSEPEAGTDLAALRTRAVRDGDCFLINGQKMWTSLIQYADYVWLACRTDPDAPRHKGLSILIDTDYPLHRYCTAAKHNEFLLGSATVQLRRIGAALARAD